MKDNDKMILDGHLNYNFIAEKYSWLFQEGQKAIISPDVDGILCGLFMSSCYSWQVVGFYDGKQLAIQQNVKPSECIFLDIEVYRKEIRSCGHHIVLYNKSCLPSSWDNFSNCINPNIIRQHDACHNFSEKYPFAMIHFMLCIVNSRKKVNIPQSAIPSLLYVDGTFKNLLNYPENCISWLNFFNAKNPTSTIYPIYVLFANRKIAKIIHDLETIFGEFKKITNGKRGGDKIKISKVVNNTFSDVERVKELINLLAYYTGWEYTPERWILTGLNVLSFLKKDQDRINNQKYLQIIEENPLSWAITGRTRGLEYTLERPDKLQVT